MDPLAPLLALADIAPAVDSARERVDQALRHRALRRHGGQVAAEVSLRSAVASAALEGYAYERETVRAVRSPIRWCRGHCGLPGRCPVWLTCGPGRLGRSSPSCTYSLLGGWSPEAELGRPVAAVPPGRLDGLAALVAGGTKVPPLVLAAVVHGELLTLRPFAGPSGVVARAAARLTLLATGFDPRGLLAVDLGHREREPEYVGAVGAFATGTEDGVRSWLRHYATAVEVAADQLVMIGDEVLATP